MAWGRRLAIASILLVVLGYWLYTPVPDGYSTSSKIRFQTFLAFFKVISTIDNVIAKTGLASHMATIKWLEKHSSHSSGADLTSITTEDTVFSGVPVRVYTPTSARDAALPGFVYYHGGGFVLGNINSSEGIPAKMCRDTNSIVVSVEYRRAPEHPFPAAINDCVSATKYFLTSLKKLNVDPNRVAIGGDSAGGNLAAVVALKLRDEGITPKIKLQVLIYPVVQAINFQLPSFGSNSLIVNKVSGAAFTNLYALGNSDYVDTIANNSHVSTTVRKQLAKTHLNVDKLPKKYLEGYTRPKFDYGDEEIWKKLKDVLLNPYFSPLFAESLADLPTAYVYTAENDLLRDEGILYVGRLREAGVKVTHFHSDIGVHGMMSFTYMPEAAEEFDKMTTSIAELLA